MSTRRLDAALRPAVRSQSPGDPAGSAPGAGICVGDLAAALGRSENAVSQALRVLRQQGWVTSTRVGRLVSYRLEDDIVHDLLHWIGAGHG